MLWYWYDYSYMLSVHGKKDVQLCTKIFQSNIICRRSKVSHIILAAARYIRHLSTVCWWHVACVHRVLILYVKGTIFRFCSTGTYIADFVNPLSCRPINFKRIDRYENLSQRYIWSANQIINTLIYFHFTARDRWTVVNIMTTRRHADHNLFSFI